MISFVGKSKKEKEGPTRTVEHSKTNQKGKMDDPHDLGISSKREDQMIEDPFKSHGETQGIISLITANHI